MKKNRAIKFNNGFTDTYALSTQITYAKDGGYLMGSVGKVGAKMYPFSHIDTDIVFPFDLSISRNNHYATSWLIGGGYQLTDDFSLSLAAVRTDAGLDSNENVNVTGTAGNLILSHSMNDGAFEGMKTLLILNKAREYRSGAKNNTLNYYDINLRISYDFTLF